MTEEQEAAEIVRRLKGDFVRPVEIDILKTSRLPMIRFVNENGVLKFVVT